MKKILASLSLVLATSACANGPHGHHHGGNRYYGGSWVAPALIGGVVGYVISQPRTVVVQQQPPVVVQPVPVQQQVCENRYVPDTYGVMRLATVCWYQ